MFYSTSHYQQMLSIERKRTERTQRPFLLLLFDISSLTTEQPQNSILENTKSAFSSSLREVDILGWYDQDKVIGVIFTEPMSIDTLAIEKIIDKVCVRLCRFLHPEWVSMLNIFYHVPTAIMMGCYRPIGSPIKTCTPISRSGFMTDISSVKKRAPMLSPAFSS